MNPLVAPEPHRTDGRTALSVNVNKIALLRNTRHLQVPDVVALSRLALEAGAQGLTVHPRPDERHIRPQDVRNLSALMAGWPQAEYNIEGNPFHNLMGLVSELRPHQCTFVPDSADQFTSNQGWCFPADLQRLKPVIAQAHDCGVRVSLFMDPDAEAMAAAREAGADRIELYTESYAQAYGGPRQDEELERYVCAAVAAMAVGLGVNAGHDLNRANLAHFLLHVPAVLEVSIGHALISDALELGLAETVRAYQRCIQRAFAAGASPRHARVAAASDAPASGSRL